MNKVAAPVSLTNTRQVNKLAINFQQDQQQTKGQPLWRRAFRRPEPVSNPPPPPQKLKSDFDFKWRAELSRRLRPEAKPEVKPEPEPQSPEPKTVRKWGPDLTKKTEGERKPEEEKKPGSPWMRRREPREPEKKPEPEKKVEPLRKPEPEKKVEPLRKPELEKKVEPLRKPEYEKKVEPLRKPEPEKKVEPLRKPEPEKKVEPLRKPGAEKRVEPLRKPEAEKKPEPEKKVEPLRKPEPEKRVESLRKPEPEKKVEPLRKPEAEKKPELEKKLEPEKKEPERKPEPLWKRKLEAEKKPEPERKPDIGKKTDSVRKLEPEKRPEPETKPEPLWKRKQEAETKREPERKPTELEKKSDPIWKSRTILSRTETMIQKQPPAEPKKELEAMWKRKQDLKKAEPEKKPPVEPIKKPVPIWKRKKEPEKVEEEKRSSEQTSEAAKNPQSEADDQNESDERDSEGDLLCPLCSELYDVEEPNQQPVLLPRCGHIFCRACLLKVKGRGHFPCPTCCKRHLKPPVEDLPVVAEVLYKAEDFREKKLGFCENHGEVLGFWCSDCRLAICGTCKVKRGHNILKTRVILRQQRQEMNQQGQEILANVEQEKQKILDNVKTCSVQLLKVCEASAVAEDSVQDVKEILSDTKQTADMQFLMGSLKRMKSILSGLKRSGSSHAVSSDAEAESSKSNTPKLRRRKERRGRSQDTARARSNSSDVKLKRTVMVDAGNNKTMQGGGVKSGKPDIPKKISTTSPINKMDVQTSHYSQQRGISGMTGEQMARVSSEGPLLGVGAASLWPLTCCVYGEDGRRARLAWEDGKLHMWALGDQVEDAHFMIKLAVLQSVIPKENPEVFMEYSVNERYLGRVYFRLWGHLRRAQHFLALCMGTHGPSYRGAKFEEVFSRGLMGECLHAGPYPTPEGGLSAQGVMDNLEWDGKFKAPQRERLVVGAGSGRPDRDSCFDICTIENRNRNFACAFGEVVSGWEVVLAVRDHRPVRAVMMSDVGVVIPDFSAAALTAPPQS